VELLPHDEYVAQLPRKTMSAAVLIRDERGRVLLVKPSYKPGWEIPGGVVENGESPWATAEREVREEIGLTRPPGRLLVVDHVPPDTFPERVAFVFDGGLIDAEAVSHLKFDPEIRAAELCDPEQLTTRTKPLLHARVRAALQATKTGETAMCEAGQGIREAWPPPEPR
jgi:8-oxo-dGTP pyrophosphatase MutT (NUDIX family)